MFDQDRAERVGVKQKKQRLNERLVKKQLRRGYIVDEDDEDEEDRSNSTKKE